jgi:hypothetical protein
LISITSVSSFCRLVRSIPTHLKAHLTRALTPLIHLIQGEVESIAQMKPKAPTEHEDGLLEYLEDIIGTSKYKAPIEEAQVEVDALNESRGEKMNRLRLVEKEKSGLEVGVQVHGITEIARVSDTNVPDSPTGSEERSRGLFAEYERSDEEEVDVMAVPHVHAAKQH